MHSMRPDDPGRDTAKPARAPRLQRLLRLTVNAVRSYIARLLRVEEEHKPDIYKTVFLGAEFVDLNYWLEIVFSIGIATLGLIISSPAVVIGAMLISPLMGPIIANGLAIAIGDFYLGLKSFVNIVLSAIGSIVIAALITWVLPFRSPTAEILARVEPTVLDLAVAVLSGMAGAIVMCRGGRGGGVTALPGVAVAVALMPPLGVVGFGVGIGWDWSIIRGGGLLFLTNLVAIIFSSFVAFFSVRMETPAVRNQINEWLDGKEKTDRLYNAIQRTPLRRMLGRVGSLPRRVLILTIFLVTVAVPLQHTLVRLKQEAQIRSIVLGEINKVIPRESIVQENVELLPGRVSVRLIAVLPGGFSAEKRRHLEESIQLRAERAAQVVVIDVTTREEVRKLTGRPVSPGPVPIVESADEIRARLWARIEPAITAVWPSDRAPLLSYWITLEPGTTAIQIHLAYLAEKELGELGEEAVRKALRERIVSSAVDARFERISPAVTLVFRSGSEALTVSARSTLEDLTAILRRFPRARCLIEVAVPHGNELNALGRRRAEQIRKYIVEEQKIEPARVEVGRTEGQRNTVHIKLLPPAQA